MTIEEPLVVDIADMTGIRDDYQRYVISGVSDGLLHLRQEQLVILSHQIEGRYGDILIDQLPYVPAYKRSDLQHTPSKTFGGVFYD